MNKNLLPSIEELTMVLGEENRDTAEDALHWMANQPPASIDETVDPLRRWEIKISFSKGSAFYYIYDKSTKEKIMLIGWYQFASQSNQTNKTGI